MRWRPRHFVMATALVFLTVRYAPPLVSRIARSVSGESTSFPANAEEETPASLIPEDWIPIIDAFFDTLKMRLEGDQHESNF